MSVQTNERAILKRSLSMILATYLALSLSACGGGKKISTKDNSVDYRSAQSLPPLKKPSRVVVTPTQVPSAAPQVTAIEPSASVAEQADSDVIREEAVVAENLIEDSSAVTAEPITEPVTLPSTPNPVLNASVVREKSGQARLEVAAGFEQAWQYLSSNLQKSDLTVFSRNKEAGRFSIGCANIAAAPTVVKSGRWSFFNRDRQENQEYCALQAVEKRGTTIVSVLNRAGEEVSGEYSNNVFSRILNN